MRLKSGEGHAQLHKVQVGMFYRIGRAYPLIGTNSPAIQFGWVRHRFVLPKATLFRSTPKRRNAIKIQGSPAKSSVPRNGLSSAEQANHEAVLDSFAITKLDEPLVRGVAFV